MTNVLVSREKTQNKRGCEDGGRSWRDSSTSQRKLRDTGSQ
jgi:hypothetical protein